MSFGAGPPNQDRYHEHHSQEEEEEKDLGLITEGNILETEVAKAPAKIEDESKPYTYMDTIGYYTGWWGTNQEQT